MCQIILEGFHHIKQPNGTSCWLACAAMAVNYLAAEDFATPKGIACRLGRDMESIGPAVEVIKKVFGGLQGFSEMPREKFAIPTESEIVDELSGKGKAGAPSPLLCCVTVGQPEPERNDELGRALGKNISGGHWILIIGIDTENKALYVADPELDEPIWVPLDYKMYKRPRKTLYWGNTTYFDFTYRVQKNETP